MRTVNPERARRYLNRTLTRPQERWLVTEAEARDVLDYEDAWRHDQDWATPPVLEWRAQVERWAKARGVRVRWLISPPHPNGLAPFGDQVITWKVDDDA